MAPRTSPVKGPMHYRRIVLYGRPASGKTCFLAALAMPRLPHPLGYSCIWVCDSQTVSTPAGNREDWDPKDPAVGRYLGREWLQRAIDSLNNNDVPRANPNDATPYRLLFDITQPDGRMTRLEMIDYSGELVDPNLSEDVLARQLLAHLEEADGILVLAEAPMAGTSADQMQLVMQHRELQILQQALMLVAAKRRKGRAEPIPVAMLLNKWDRFSQMKEYDPATAAVEADTFMDRVPPVPQKVLYNVLRAVAGSADGESFSAKFPVSAFGKTRKGTRHEPNGLIREVEAPQTLTPLQSYGLEDPLVWVCQKADTLQMRELKANVAGLATWKVWHATTRRALRVRADALEFKKRVPGHLPESATLGGLAHQALVAFGKQSLFALVFFSVLAFAALQAAVLAYDDHRYTRIYPALKAAEAGADPVEWAEKWKEAGTFLAAYAKPSWFRLASHHRLLAAESARKLLADLQPQLKEAERILAVREEFDTKVDALVKSVAATEDLEEAEKKRRELRSLEIPPEYPNGGPKKAGGIARVDERVEAIRVARDSEDLRKEFQDLMRRHQLAQAAELLSKKERALPAMAESLRRDFKDQWHTLLTSEVKQLCVSQDQWDRAKNLIAELLNSKDALALVGSIGRTSCNTLVERIEKHRAASVYAKWYRNPTNQHAYEQLQKYGSSAHRSVAVEWTAYQKFCSDPRTWSVVMEEISTSDHGGWGFGPTDARISCSHGGTYLCSESVTFTKKPDRATLRADGPVYTKAYRDEISLSFRYDTTNWVTSNISGNGSWNGKISDLVAGVTVTITTPSGYSNVYLKARIKPRDTSMPNAPSLPTPTEVSF